MGNTPTRLSNDHIEPSGPVGIKLKITASTETVLLLVRTIDELFVYSTKAHPDPKDDEYYFMDQGTQYVFRVGDAVINGVQLVPRGLTPGESVKWFPSVLSPKFTRNDGVGVEIPAPKPRDLYEDVPVDLC